MRPRERTARSPRFYVFAVLLIAVLAGLGWWLLKDDEEKNAQFTEVKVTRGDIEEAVTAQGKLEPKEYVDVGAQVSGQLKKLNVELGQQVKKGDLIAEIDAELYASSVAADEAGLKTFIAQRAEQEANVAQASKILNRDKTLIAAKAVSQEEFETSETAFKVAKAKLNSLDAQIEEAKSTLEGNKAKLNYTKIYAPMDGTVVSQSAREGQTLNANQTTPTIVQIANLDIMTVRAQVAEADIPKIKEGMEVYFTTLGSNNRRWQGKVRQILPTPENINDVVLYNVLVDVDNKDRQLMTQMSTQMFFVLGRAKNVLTLPASALVKRKPDADNDQGQGYQVRVKGKDGPQLVHAGLSDRANTEIRDGLQENDVVMVPAAAAPANKPAGAAGGRQRMPRL